VGLHPKGAVTWQSEFRKTESRKSTSTRINQSELFGEILT